MGVIRSNVVRKCCCEEGCTQVFKLSQCPDTTCPDDGVFVTCSALEWLQLHGGTYIFCYSNLCCLVYLEGVTEQQDYDELPEGGVLIYSETEGGAGATIQSFGECTCNDCGLPTGACCYESGRRFLCEVTDQQDCYDSHPAASTTYGGDGTCCQELIGDCTSDNPLSVECEDPDPPEDCRLYTGYCVEKGDTITTCGTNGQHLGCDTTYQISVSFPALQTYTGEGDTTGQYCGSLGDADCDHHAGDNNYCCTDICEGTSGQGAIIATDPMQDRWTTVGLVDGGDLGGRWKKSSFCLLSLCPLDLCYRCESHASFEPCWNAISGWACPCCHATKFMDTKFFAEISNISSHHNPNQNGYCEPPCNSYQISITFIIGINGCMGEADCGGNCNDCAGEDAGDICYYTSYRVNYYVRRPECGCPSGLNSGSAHLVQVVNSEGLPIDFEKCHYGCGCAEWIPLVQGYMVKANQIRDGLTWSIS